jgi:hypothetical protein
MKCLIKHPFIEVNSISDNYAKEFHWGYDVEKKYCFVRDRWSVPQFGNIYKIEDQCFLPIKIFGSEEPNTLILVNDIIKKQFEMEGKYTLLKNNCIHASQRAWAGIQYLNILHEEFGGLEKSFQEQQKNLQEYENMKSMFSKKILNLQNGDTCFT